MQNNKKIEIVKIHTEYIKLEQLFKYAGIVGSGSDAKVLITKGIVRVNGEIEPRRGRKLKVGDIIEFEGKKLVID